MGNEEIEKIKEDVYKNMDRYETHDDWVKPEYLNAAFKLAQELAVKDALIAEKDKELQRLNSIVGGINVENPSAIDLLIDAMKEQKKYIGQLKADLQKKEQELEQAHNEIRELATQRDRAMSYLEEVNLQAKKIADLTAKLEAAQRALEKVAKSDCEDCLSGNYAKDFLASLSKSVPGKVKGE